MSNRFLKTKYTISNNDICGVTNFENDGFKIIQEEIDNEFLFDTLTNIGWYRFNEPHTQQWLDSEIEQWLQTNCLGKFIYRSGVCIIENKDDAVKFNLTWC